MGVGLGRGVEGGHVFCFQKNLVFFLVSPRKLRISSSFAERSEKLDLNLNGFSS